MTKKSIIGIGAGGHGRTVAECIERSGIYRLHSWVDAEANLLNRMIMGAEVIGDDSALLKLKKLDVNYCFIGTGSIGNSQTRQAIAKKSEDIGFEHPTIIDPSAIVSAYSKIAKGTCILPMAVVNTNTSIEAYAIINTGSVVEHDCWVGSFVHIAPSATLAANVKIGNYTHIGAGAVIKEGVTIGSHVIVGAGAVVIDDIDDHSKVAGCPAKPIGYN